MACDLRSNWAGLHRYRAAAIHQPSTIEEVRRLVAGARRVRALGSRHSFNAVADSEDGDLIWLGRIPARIAVDRDRMEVIVGAGATYAELGAELEGQGLALHNLASLPHVTVAGAIATGTHGSGDGNGNLATAVRGLELVRPDGTLAQVVRDDPDWGAFPVALGYLGLVTRVTLAVQPSFRVRQHVYRAVPWEEVLERFDEVMAGGYSVSIFTRWQGSTVEQVWCKSVDASTEPVPVQRFGGVLSPVTHTVGALEGSNVTARDGSPGPWWLRLPHFRPDGRPSFGDEVQSEYLVGRAQAAAALAAVRALADRIEPLLLVTELRTVAADELWLSPMYERPTLAIHFTWRKDPVRVRALLPEIERALAPFAARPHWGKVFAMEGRDLRSRYPLLPRFRDLARRWDPDGTFSNDYYRTYLQEA
ncbi:MAG: D-arabinono-1,4-lactone oxidase [Candidatus Dormibacteraceae bacterium]